jgi:L-iditol 2-dehydrogenase
MKALRLHNIGDVRLHEEEVPTPQAGEALLRVTAVGICGSDIHWFAEGTTGAASFTEPFVLGHEFAAVVESGVLKGRRVAVEPHVPCGRCEFCESGNPNLCPYHYFAGQAPRDGALREYMCWPESMLFPIPDNVSNEAGALLEPLGVAIHTMDLGKVRVGQRVGVFGCGPIGLMVVQLARLMGAVEIVATDKLAHRRDAAAEMGATAVFGPGAQNLSEVDVAFEVAGDQGAIDDAVESVRPGGRVVLCGIPSVDTVTFKASTARRKGLTVKFVRRMKHTYPRAISLVSKGLINLDAYVTKRYGLAEGMTAFQEAEARGGLKVVINP